MEDPESDFNKTKIRSPTWNYFKRLSPGFAKCELCKKKLSFKTSITNLKRHLLLKHKVNLGYKITKPFTKLDQQINIKRLIRMVKQHPCLWDIHNRTFNNKTQINEAWNTIAFSLCPDMNPVIAVAKLSERFSALKENFFADRLRLGNGINIRPSIYYQDLVFLDSSNDVINISSSSSVSEELEPSHTEFYEINEVGVKSEPPEVSCIEDGLQNVPSAVNETTSAQATDPEGRGTQREIEAIIAPAVGMKDSRRNVTKTVSSHRKENKYEPNTIPQYMVQLQNADRDVLFLLSMTEELKKVPKDMKTTFKGELMMTVSQLVKKYNRTICDGYVREYV